MQEVKPVFIRKGRGYVYCLRYHIVFCTKHRHELIGGQVETRLREMFQSLAKLHKFELITMEIMPDYVHLLVGCVPQHYIPNILKALKGNTARFLFKEFPDLKKRSWGGHLWNPSYFVASVGENTEETIKNYIQSQKKE